MLSAGVAALRIVRTALQLCACMHAGCLQRPYCMSYGAVTCMLRCLLAAMHAKLLQLCMSLSYIYAVLQTLRSKNGPAAVANASVLWRQVFSLFAYVLFALDMQPAKNECSTHVCTHVCALVRGCVWTMQGHVSPVVS
jgi:hypothetical protein